MNRLFGELCRLKKSVNYIRYNNETNWFYCYKYVKGKTRTITETKIRKKTENDVTKKSLESGPLKKNYFCWRYLSSVYCFKRPISFDIYHVYETSEVNTYIDQSWQCSKTIDWRCNECLRSFYYKWKKIYKLKEIELRLLRRVSLQVKCAI